MTRCELCGKPHLGLEHEPSVLLEEARAAWTALKAKMPRCLPGCIDHQHALGCAACGACANWPYAEFAALDALLGGTGG